MGDDGGVDMMGVGDDGVWGMMRCGGLWGVGFMGRVI